MSRSPKETWAWMMRMARLDLGTQIITGSDWPLTRAWVVGIVQLASTWAHLHDLSNEEGWSEACIEALATMPSPMLIDEEESK